MVENVKIFVNVIVLLLFLLSGVKNIVVVMVCLMGVVYIFMLVEVIENYVKV